MRLPSADELEQLEDIGNYAKYLLFTLFIKRINRKAMGCKSHAPCRDLFQVDLYCWSSSASFNKVKPTSALNKCTQSYSSIDDEILQDFETTFPEINLVHLDEEHFKTPAAKEKWRNFMNKYEKRVKEFNFGSLIRIDCREDYTEQNTMFGKLYNFFKWLLLIYEFRRAYAGMFLCVITIIRGRTFY